MKKLLLSFSLLAALTSAKAQTTLFEDSFDTYTDFAIANVGNWTLTDVDQNNAYGFTGVTFANSGGKKSFQVFNATTTVPALDASDTSDWTARTGDKFMVCFAATSTPSGTALNNDWLISPQITLGASGNTLTFWAKSCDATYGLERFKVGVSTTDTAIANFTVVSAGSYITTADDITWAEYTYDLDAYPNMPVYISINCVSNDQFGFGVDDFKVTTTALATGNFFTQNFSVYPNPATNVLNVNTKNDTSINTLELTDVNGRVVRSMDAKGVSNTQINIADLNSGVYFLKVTADKGVGTTRIIKN